MKNEVKVEDPGKELKKDGNQNSLNKQVLVGITLRNNASRFQKEPELRNLILVRNKNEIDRQKVRVYEDPSNHQITIEHENESDNTQNDSVHEATGLINENHNEQDPRTVIRAEDKELENILNQILQDLEHCTMLEMHPREKLPKLKLTPDIEEC